RYESQFLPVQSPLNILVYVVSLLDDAVTPPLPNLFGRFFPADDIQRFDSSELRQRDDVLPHGGVGCGLTDPVAGHQGHVSVQQKISGNRVDPDHRELQGICLVAHRYDVAHRDDNLVCPCTLLQGRENQDALTLQSNINLRARLGDSPDALRTYREW